MTTSFSVGPDGGTVQTDAGVSLQFRAGSVDSVKPITVTATGTPAPSTFSPVTPIYQFGPDGIVFAHPVTVSIPVPAGTASASMYWSRMTDAGLVYDDIGGSVDGGFLVAQVVHFSEGFAGAALTTRTISGSQVVTYVTSSRPDIINRPIDFSQQPISALIETDAGFTELPGTGQADGTFVIPGVPNGEYMLKGALGEYFVTSRDAIDLGNVTNGRPDAVAATAAHLTIDVGNLNAWQPTDQLELLVPDVNMSFFGVESGDLSGSVPDAGVTSWRFTMDTTDLNYGNPARYLIQGSHSPPDTAILCQQVSVTSDAGFPYLQMQRIAVLPPFDTVSNGTASVTAALVDLSATNSLRYDVRTTQFEALIGRTADAGFTPTVGPASNWVPQFTQASIDVQGIAGGFGYGPVAWTADFAMGNWAYGGPDFDTGGMSFGVPPGQNWGVFTGVFFSVPYRYRLPCTVGPDCPSGISRTGPAPTVAGLYMTGDAVALTAGPIVPLLSTVQAPMLNGQPLFADQTGAGLSPVLTWSAPSIGTPTRYRIQVYHLHLVLDGSGMQTTLKDPVARLVTPRTRLRLPPGIFTAGEPYVIKLTAEHTTFPGADQAPMRTAFPSETAAVMSGIIRP